MTLRRRSAISTGPSTGFATRSGFASASADAGSDVPGFRAAGAETFAMKAVIEDPRDGFGRRLVGPDGTIHVRVGRTPSMAPLPMPEAFEARPEQPGRTSRIDSVGPWSRVAIVTIAP